MYIYYMAKVEIIQQLYICNIYNIYLTLLWEISFYKEALVACVTCEDQMPSFAAVAGSLPPGQVPLQEQLLIYNKFKIEIYNL